MIAIALAEMGDKTQLSILLLSSKTKEHLKLFLGIFLAFLIVDGLAIALGYWITNILPMWLLGFISGAIFLSFGILNLANETRRKGKAQLQQAHIDGFLAHFRFGMGR